MILLEFPIEWFDSNNMPDSDLKKSLEDETQKDGIRDGQLAWKYCQNKSIPCRPFDIKGRNAFFKKHRIFERLSIFEDEIEKYVHNHPIQKSALESFGKLHNECLLSSPENLNSLICDQVMRSQEDYTYLLYQEARRSNSLKDQDFYQIQKEYWDLRNKTMAENICTISANLTSKKVVVITGVDHHYYLMDLLSKCHSVSVSNWY